MNISSNAPGAVAEQGEQVDAVHGSVTTPTGWRAGIAACGTKYSGRNDLALVVSDSPCTAAALFTTNRVKSAHIHYDMDVLSRNTQAIRGVLINAGSANACTGAEGIAASGTVAHFAEQTLAVPENSMLVMFTGVIGIPLPIDKVQQGICIATQNLTASHGIESAQAIMTTDTRPKHGAIQIPMSDGSTIHIGGMAKGSGMIHPTMATLLSTITTDAAITSEALDAALRYVADRSFHCISIDGDTSTNDTLLALANGQANNTPIANVESSDGQAFVLGLLHLCRYLAREIARDGEGASRLITIHIQGAASYHDAHQVAMTIARSPLVKTALFGADPNWGRVVCAIGYSGVPIDPERMLLHFGDTKVFAQGVPLPFDEQAVHQLLNVPNVTITAHLGMGEQQATVWTCDFSYDYVKINAEYRS